MIRVHHEPARSCNACGERKPVTLLVIGTSQIRVCGLCWTKLDRARVLLATGGYDSVEVK